MRGFVARSVEVPGDAERKEREKLYRQVRKVLKEAEKRQAARRRKAPPTPADVTREEAIKKAQQLVELLSGTEPEQKMTTYHLQATLGGGVELTKDASWQKLRGLVIDQLGEELTKALDEGE